MRSFIAGVSLLVLPFFIQFGVYDAIRIPKLKFMVGMAVCMGAFFVARHVSVSLSLAFVVLAFNGLLNGFGVLHSYYFIWGSSAVLLTFLINGLNEKDRFRILDFLCLSGVLNSVYAYVQMSGNDIVFPYRNNGDYFTPIGFLGQQTLFGPFLASCAIACLFRKRYLAFVFCLIPTIATNSSFTWASLSAGILVWTCMRFSKKVTISILICMIFGVFLTYRSDNPRIERMFNDQGRAQEWSNMLDHAKKKPIFGHGVGTFKRLYFTKSQTTESKERHGKFIQAHNDYIELFFEAGIVGCMAILICLVDFFVSLYRKRNDVSIMAFGAIFILYLVNALGSFPFKLAPHGLLALWCFIIVTWRHDGCERFIHTLRSCYGSCSKLWKYGFSYFRKV